MSPVPVKTARQLFSVFVQGMSEKKKGKEKEGKQTTGMTEDCTGHGTIGDPAVGGLDHGRKGDNGNEVINANDEVLHEVRCDLSLRDKRNLPDRLRKVCISLGQLAWVCNQRGGLGQEPVVCGLDLGFRGDIPSVLVDNECTVEVGRRADFLVDWQNDL